MYPSVHWILEKMSATGASRRTRERRHSWRGLQRGCCPTYAPRFQLLLSFTISRLGSFSCWHFFLDRTPRATAAPLGATEWLSQMHLPNLDWKRWWKTLQMSVRSLMRRWGLWYQGGYCESIKRLARQHFIWSHETSRWNVPLEQRPGGKRSTPSQTSL